MCSTSAVRELRGIGNRPPPPLPAGERTRSGRHPENHAALVEIWALEKPLPTSEMARASYRVNVLIEAADPDTEPTLIVAAQVSSYDAGRDLVRIVVGPSNA